MKHIGTTIRSAVIRGVWLMAGTALLALIPSTMGAGTASADTVNWDAIAQCESGGNWSTDTGNGTYGGLQFKQATWATHGGVGNPASASRAEQIRVAERVLATQGLDAWPKCGAQAARPAVWGTTTPATGCAAIRGGSLLGILDLRQLCSSVLRPLTSIGLSH
jgi:resuscitation-promoting factor RpfC